MQTLVLGDQSGFSFEAIQLIRYFICAINHITDASAFANDLSYNIAFEGIAFPKWMGASGFCLVLKRASILYLPDIKGTTVRPIQDIYVQSPCKTFSISVGIRLISIDQHFLPPNL